MHASGLLTSLTTRTLTDCPPSQHDRLHRSDPGRASGRVGHGGGSQRDLGTERDGRGAGNGHYPEFPTAQRLLLLLVLLLQLLMPFYHVSLTVRNEEERRRRSRRKRISQDTKMEIIPNCEVCTKPSVEEIRLWSQSFDKLMRNPAGRNVFREFLRTEYSEENMLFWLACEDLKQEINKSAIEEKARSIYEDYISILSPKEVSLDARVREVINRRIQDPTPHAFEDAQLQIYTLMHRDSYPRFLSSNIYKSLIHDGSRTSSES
ncbi:regulator of G-protein signaling 19 isoform X2 [Siniperca chuatsi]|uniref:regulator of G-protein signaling 19 isoform X2 n=1 Tax=Siniperca chuatsi TaxID=119488 RepID=UPI001CE1ADFF|nr:regulator of G-protein signaling 19 isoform X2 [Siniperca chuatsi]XP_044066056.1 regulator of G-protein signaling 19 isoform X2 [Siniperca chuatsi]